MESYLKIFFIALLSLVLIASPSDGRNDPKASWGDMMKGQPMPEALKDYINHRSYQAHEKIETNRDFIKDFEPFTNVFHYRDDVNPKEVRSQKEDCNSQHHDKQVSKKLFDDEFEPIPNVSVYND